MPFIYDYIIYLFIIIYMFIIVVFIILIRWYLLFTTKGNKSFSTMNPQG
jgi:hypothetical protein